MSMRGASSKNEISSLKSSRCSAAPGRNIMARISLFVMAFFSTYLMAISFVTICLMLDYSKLANSLPADICILLFTKGVALFYSTTWTRHLLSAVGRRILGPTASNWKFLLFCILASWWGSILLLAFLWQSATELLVNNLNVHKMNKQRSCTAMIALMVGRSFFLCTDRLVVSEKNKPIGGFVKQCWLGQRCLAASSGDYMQIACVYRKASREFQKVYGSIDEAGAIVGTSMAKTLQVMRTDGEDPRGFKVETIVMTPGGIRAISGLGTVTGLRLRKTDGEAHIMYGGCGGETAAWHIVRSGVDFKAEISSRNEYTRIVKLLAESIIAAGKVHSEVGGGFDIFSFCDGISASTLENAKEALQHIVKRSAGHELSGGGFSLGNSTITDLDEKRQNQQLLNVVGRAWEENYPIPSITSSSETETEDEEEEVQKPLFVRRGTK